MFFRLWLAFVLSTSITFAADDLETLNMRNGRFWSQLAPDDPVKAFYVLGLLDGWELRDRVPGETNMELIAAMVPRRDSLPMDLAKMLTSIYGDAENLRLPVGWVVLGSMAVIRGDTDRAAMLAALRAYLIKVGAGDSRTNGTAFSADDVVKVIRGCKTKCVSSVSGS